jgi:beta-lactamase class A
MRIVFVCIGIIASFFSGYLFKELLTPNISIVSGKQVRQGGYSFINPLLECELGEKALSKQIVTFKYKVEDEIAGLKKQKMISDMGVYFRDLNNGIGFGVNEKEGFSPASLLKLPVMITYFKEAETNPVIMQRKLKYVDEDRNQGEVVKPSSQMKKGQEYEVQDLLERMIVQSDNNAMALLVENMPLTTQDRVYTDLGITVPGVRGIEDFMSVSENAAFFRILYNASYLSKDSSEKALKMLSLVDFDRGIRAGVPDRVPLANKFGERVFNGMQQLHDCGIVYYGDHPYLLCVMSRGHDFDSLAKSISKISSVVYQEVDRQAKNPLDK